MSGRLMMDDEFERWLVRAWRSFPKFTTKGERNGRTSILTVHASAGKFVITYRAANEPPARLSWSSRDDQGRVLDIGGSDTIEAGWEAFHARERGEITRPVRYSGDR